MKTSHRVALVLATILISAAALRVWYASGELHVSRFEDERYSLQNVRKIYFTGDLEPASGYYPSPVFNLPQVWLLKAGDAIYRATGRDAFQTFDEEGQLHAAGFLITRLYQTLCGVLSVWLIFLIGRRLFDARVGLVAALFFAFLPWALHSSGYNKPDALLVLGICVAFWASLRAMDGGRWVDYGLAGLGIALAMSAKLTGGLIAIPLVVGTGFAFFHERQSRRLIGLATAGVVSALAFVLVNPFWQAYLHFIRGLQRDYAGRTEDSRWEIPWKVIELLSSDTLFGPRGATLALIGGLVLTAAWLMRKEPCREDAARLRLVMFLSFPLIYVVAYAAQTSYFKPNNFLPVVPFSSVALGWLLVAGWDLIRSRIVDRLPALPRVAARALPWVAGLIVVAMAVPNGFNYVYQSRVATTYDVARVWLDHQLQPPNGRLIYQDPWPHDGLTWEGQRALHHGLSAATSDPLPEAIPGRDVASRYDAMVLQRRGHDTEIAEDPAWTAKRIIEPRLLRVRGPALLVMARGDLRQDHDAELATLETCGDGCLQARVPHGDGEETWSLFIRLPTWALRSAADVPTLDLDGVELPLYFASTKGNGHLYVTPRLPVPAAAPNAEFPDTAAVLKLSQAPDDAGDAALDASVGHVVVQVQRWRPLD